MQGEMKNKWRKDYETVKNCDRWSNKIMKLEKREKEKVFSEKLKFPLIDSNRNEETILEGKNY